MGGMSEVYVVNDISEEKEVEPEKLYIAGPMRGIKEFNYPLFNSVAEAYRDVDDVVVFNPAERDNTRHNTDVSKGNEKGCLKQAEEEYGFSLREALSEDLQWICEEATGIVMLPNWETSLGARAEHATAVALGLDIIYWG